ncbi:hypothetical protein EK904_005487 [Melospiza melodia maxima]|nr:hypothetical protein EK904_005487 [Melospiza melodia maxima]
MCSWRAQKWQAEQEGCWWRAPCAHVALRDPGQMHLKIFKEGRKPVRDSQRVPRAFCAGEGALSRKAAVPWELTFSQCPTLQRENEEALSASLFTLGLLSFPHFFPPDFYSSIVFLSAEEKSCTPLLKFREFCPETSPSSSLRSSLKDSCVEVIKNFFSISYQIIPNGICAILLFPWTTRLKIHSSSSSFINSLEKSKL